MKLNTLILIMSLLCLLWGVGFILLPVSMWSMYGLTLDTSGVYISRELGTIFFTLGIILWLARNEPGLQIRRTMAIGLFIGNLLGCVVTLIGQFSAEVNAMGWVGFLMYALLALGFGYYTFKAPI